MKKFLVSLSLMALLSLLFAGLATAQDGPTLTVDPASVEAEGEAELTVSGAGFTPMLDLFVLSCIAPDGDLEAINGQEDCNVQDLTPVTVEDDGTFSVAVTYDIVENFAVLAGDSAQTESAGALVTISGDGGTSTTEAPTSTTEAPTSTTEAPTTTVAGEDEATDTEDGELPDTGAESNILIGGALALAAAGVLATRGGQLLGRR